MKTKRSEERAIKRMKKREIDTRLLATFLKSIKETTKGPNGCNMSIASEAKEAGIKYAPQLASVMIEKGIVERKEQYRRPPKYIWLTTTEPNLIMAKAILDECRTKFSYIGKRVKPNDKIAIKKSELGREVYYKMNTYIPNEKPVLKLRAQINQIRLGLTNLGFDENASDEIIRTYLLTY